MQIFKRRSLNQLFCGDLSIINFKNQANVPLMPFLFLLNFLNQPNKKRFWTSATCQVCISWENLIWDVNRSHLLENSWHANFESSNTPNNFNLLPSTGLKKQLIKRRRSNGQWSFATMGHKTNVFQITLFLNYLKAHQNDWNALFRLKSA